MIGLFSWNRRIFDIRFLPMEIIREKAKFLASLWAKTNGLFEHATINDPCRSN